MSKYSDWNDFLEKRDDGLLDVSMSFDSMTKGVLSYSGKFNGKKVYCAVSECVASDYCFNKTETVSDVTQGEYVFLTLDGETVLSW